MSAREDGWVALEDASSAFERPSWAIRALVEQGKLERKVEHGRIYVRAPRPQPAAAGAASPSRATAPPASHAPEPMMRERTTHEPPTHEPPTREPTAHEPTIHELAAELARLIPDAAAPGTPPPALALALERAAPGAPVVDLRDPVLWSEVAANLADLAHAARARDALLARTAQTLREVERAASRPAPEPPRARRAPWALVLVLVTVSLAAFATARIESTTAASDRQAAELASERAAFLEARAAHEQRELATLAASLARPAPAATSSATAALPAGFTK